MIISNTLRALIATTACSFALLPAGGARAAESDLPRYKLPIGRVLTYTSEGRSKEQGRPEQADSSGKLRLTVVAANPDGSSRIIVRQSSQYRGGREMDSLGGFDVHPDGRKSAISGFNPRVQIDIVLPRLPETAEQASSSWTAPPRWDSTITTFAPAKSSDAKRFTFTGVEDGPASKIYVLTRKSTFEFDRDKGAIVEVKSEYSQGYGFQQTGTNTTKLESDETIDAAEAAALAKDYTIFFAAQHKREETLEQAYEHPERAQEFLNDADTAFKAAARQVKSSEVAKQFDESIRQSGESAKYFLDRAKKLADTLNKPAPEWNAEDLEGKQWSQSGLRGKVVVMDFWYRGCGWCIFAMPQVKQLAEDYKNQPVAVLGMNTDRKVEDAKFVVDALDLRYPQIRAQDVTDKFQVQAFPTLIIIDQDGVVRRVHTGYSADLREKVAKQIDALLAKKPA